MSFFARYYNFYMSLCTSQEKWMCQLRTLDMPVQNSSLKTKVPIPLKQHKKSGQTETSFGLTGLFVTSFDNVLYCHFIFLAFNTGFCCKYEHFIFYDSKTFPSIFAAFSFVTSNGANAASGSTATRSASSSISISAFSLTYSRIGFTPTVSHANFL